jgi:hypothetical protein
VKRNTTVARVTEADARLERIKHLQGQLAPAPVNSRQRRKLRVAIRIEADAYRKSLDTEQAAATHDAKPTACYRVGMSESRIRLSKPTLVPRRRIHIRSRVPRR